MLDKEGAYTILNWRCGNDLRMLVSYFQNDVSWTGTSVYNVVCRQYFISMTTL